MVVDVDVDVDVSGIVVVVVVVVGVGTGEPLGSGFLRVTGRLGVTSLDCFEFGLLPA